MSNRIKKTSGKISGATSRFFGSVDRVLRTGVGAVGEGVGMVNGTLKSVPVVGYPFELVSDVLFGAVHGDQKAENYWLGLKVDREMKAEAKAKTVTVDAFETAEAGAAVEDGTLPVGAC